MNHSRQSQRKPQCLRTTWRPKIFCLLAQRDFAVAAGDVLLQWFLEFPPDDEQSGGAVLGAGVADRFASSHSETLQFVRDVPDSGAALIGSKRPAMLSLRFGGFVEKHKCPEVPTTTGPAQLSFLRQFTAAAGEGSSNRMQRTPPSLRHDSVHMVTKTTGLQLGSWIA